MRNMFVHVSRAFHAVLFILVECSYRYVLEVFLSEYRFCCNYHARVVFNKCSAYVCIILSIFPRYLIFDLLTYGHIVSNLKCFCRNAAFVTIIVLVLNLQIIIKNQHMSSTYFVRSGNVYAKHIFAYCLRFVTT